MVELIKQNFKENKKLFNKEKKRINASLNNKYSITHVGSTSIPYMIGKNIIDILIGVDGNNELDIVKEKLEKLGYHEGHHSTEIYKFFANTENETKSGDYHIHLVVMNTDRYNDFIKIKKLLTENKEERRKYIQCKKSILLKSNIRKEYREIKGKYVDDLLIRARKYYENK